MSQRGILAALTLLSILLAAGVVHITSLLILPWVAPDDAFARLAAVTPEGSVAELGRGGSPGAALPDRDPAMATAVCRYDLDRGPLRASATLGDGSFVSLTLHARSGVAFYGLTDRAGNDGRLEIVVMTAGQLNDARAKDSVDAPVRDVRVVAPQSLGFVMFDVLPRIAGEAEMRRALSSMSCRVEHPL